MKSLTATSTTRPTPLLRRGLAVVTTGLMVVTIGFGLARREFSQSAAGLVAPSAGVDVYRALDQHERHLGGFGEYSTPLDQHERHLGGFGEYSTPLDQHERHPASFPNLNLRW